jgi:hypothetical protein
MLCCKQCLWWAVLIISVRSSSPCTTQVMDVVAKTLSSALDRARFRHLSYAKSEELPPGYGEREEETFATQAHRRCVQPCGPPVLQPVCVSECMCVCVRECVFACVCV